MTYYICTENMTIEDRAAWDRLLLESDDQREAREVAPLLAAMGGVRVKRA